MSLFYYKYQKSQFILLETCYINKYRKMVEEDSPPAGQTGNS